MSPVLQGNERRENEEERERKRENRTRRKGKKERITREEKREERRYSRAGMSRLLVSQTRRRYLQADQWQSTARPRIFVGSSVAVVS